MKFFRMNLTSVIKRMEMGKFVLKEDVTDLYVGIVVSSHVMYVRNHLFVV